MVLAEPSETKGQKRTNHIENKIGSFRHFGYLHRRKKVGGLRVEG